MSEIQLPGKTLSLLRSCLSVLSVGYQDIIAARPSLLGLNQGLRSYICSHMIERLGRWLYANSRHYANSRNMPITHRTASICAHSALLVNTPHGVISNQFECNCLAPNIYYLSRFAVGANIYPSRFDFDCKTTSSNKF